MRFFLICLLTLLASSSFAVELSKEQLQAIIKSSPSEDAEEALKIYPRCEAMTFSITTVDAKGQSTTLNAQAKEWYVDKKYLVGKIELPDGQSVHFVRTYDPDMRLYYGWNVQPDGTILNQSGMYNSETRVMSWLEDETINGNRIVLRSIQSFTDKSRNTWKSFIFMNGAFHSEQNGACEYKVFDNRL